MNRVGCVTNFEHRHIRNFIWCDKMPITFKTFFAVFLAWLNPDQAARISARSASAVVVP